MRNPLIRATALTCALLTTTALTAPAAAQSGLISATLAPPAERLAVTPGGVDMRTGRYNYHQTDVSIGEDNETGGLALTRSLGTDAIGHISPFANFSHNFDIFLDLKTIQILSDGTGPGTQVRVHFGGRSETFEQSGSSGPFTQVSRSGYARLTLAGGVYSFFANDGTVAVFRTATDDCSTVQSCSYVATVTYADGTRFTFDYDAAGSAGTAHLRAVSSNRGYALALQYGSGGDANHIASACVISLAAAPAPAAHACPASPIASTNYSYTTLDGARRLASATDAAGGGAWSFGYSGTASVFAMTFTRPGEGSPWLTNSVSVRPTNDTIDELISHQTFADGSTFSYSYDISPPVEGEIPQIAGGSYVDPAGHTVTVRYDFPIKPGSTYGNPGGPPGAPQTLFYQITPGPVEIVDALGRSSSTDYCDPYAAANLPSYEHHRCLVDPMPVSFTSPEGIQTELSWDLSTRTLTRARQHAQAGSLDPDGNPWADIDRSATYNCTSTTMAICTKPITRTDANSNVTDDSYDTGHGGLLAETAPAAASGQPRPQTRHAYAQRYAWLSNGSGGYAQAATPIWVRISTSICRTSAATGTPSAPCATAGDEVLTQYDYGPNSGPNTLLLRGQTVTATDGGTTTTLRTCYGYDARGRRISETQPDALLSSCP